MPAIREGLPQTRPHRAKPGRPALALARRGRLDIQVYGSGQTPLRPPGTWRCEGSGHGLLWEREAGPLVSRNCPSPSPPFFVTPLPPPMHIPPSLLSAYAQSSTVPGSHDLDRPGGQENIRVPPPPQRGHGGSIWWGGCDYLSFSHVEIAEESEGCGTEFAFQL